MAYKHDIVDGKKWCTNCKIMHPIEEFNKHKASSNGLNIYCKKSLLKEPKPLYAIINGEKKLVDLKGTRSKQEYMRKYKKCPVCNYNKLTALSKKLESGLVLYSCKECARLAARVKNGSDTKPKPFNKQEYIRLYGKCPKCGSDEIKKYCHPYKNKTTLRCLPCGREKQAKVRRKNGQKVLANTKMVVIRKTGICPECNSSNIRINKKTAVCRDCEKKIRDKFPDPYVRGNIQTQLAYYGIDAKKVEIPKEVIDFKRALLKAKRVASEKLAKSNQIGGHSTLTSRIKKLSAGPKSISKQDFYRVGSCPDCDNPDIRTRNTGYWTKGGYVKKSELYCYNCHYQKYNIPRRSTRRTKADYMRKHNCCPDCGSEEIVFWKCSKTRRSSKFACLACNRESKRKFYHNNREEVRKQQREYYHNNREKIRKQQREAYHKKRQEMKKQQKVC